ncbi:hypothetical protein PR048_009586 [Dryococelus australis]|uniref:Uncharacterized protein n=1 Tax=Dryococelus australis TaxID=614101 RepID=A0ABQ9I1A5_9NEOP|nr:hypothetical protein PR048_009586 [Dryococelus australis]
MVQQFSVSISDPMSNRVSNHDGATMHKRRDDVYSSDTGYFLGSIEEAMKKMAMKVVIFHTNENKRELSAKLLYSKVPLCVHLVPATRNHKSQKHIMWKSRRTMPLVGGFSRESPVSPAVSFRRCSLLISITLIGSQNPAVKSRPNLFTHTLQIYRQFNQMARVLYTPNMSRS